jgi:hypothetical protein
MRCNVGKNSTGQRAMSLFVGGLSCGVGGLHGCSGASCGIGGLGVGCGVGKDKQRQEEAAAKQCRADTKRVMVLVMPPDPIDAATWPIWAECVLRTAPLDAIMAKIAHDNIVHDPTAMLSPPPAL